MSVNEVLEAVRAMSPEERAQVKALLDTLPPEQLSPQESGQTSAEDELERELIAEGIIVDRSELNLSPDTSAPLSAFKPVPATGKPVSEIVIEERR